MLYNISCTKTSSCTVMVELRKRMFGNRAPRRVFQTQIEKVTGFWLKVHTFS
jgi:hypothetical protein